MAAYQNLNYIYYAAIVISNYNSFIYINSNLIVDMIILSSVLPHEPIDNYSNGRHFLYFLLFFMIIFKIFPAFVPISWGFLRDFFIFIYFFNFIFYFKIKKNIFEFQDFAAYTRIFQSDEKIAYRHLRKEKTYPNMRCYG